MAVVEQPRDLNHQVQYIRKTPREGNGSLAMDSTGGTTRSFEFGGTTAKALLLNQDFLHFKMEVKTTTSGLGHGHDHGWVIFANILSMFDRLELLTSDGTNLLNYTRVDLGTRIMTLPNTSRQELADCDIASANDASATLSIGTWNTTQQSNALDTLAASSWVVMTGGTGINADGVRSYTDPAWCLAAQSGLTANPTNTRMIDMKFDLRKLKHTIYELKRARMFNQPLIFRFTLGPASRVGYICADPTSSLVEDGTSAPGLTITLSDMYYYSAQEENKNINDVARAELTSGYSFYFEHPSFFQTVLSGTNQILNVRCSKQQGQKLRRIYAAMITSTSNYDVQYGIDNATNWQNSGTRFTAKVSQFYQTWMGQRLQPYNYVTNVLDDYFANKSCYDGTAISSGLLQQQNWAVIQSWERNPKKPYYERPPEDVSEGFDLSNALGGGEFIYSVDYTTTDQSNNHYAFIIGEKIATVTMNGVTVV